MVKIFESNLVICVLFLNYFYCAAQKATVPVSLPDKAPIVLSPVNRINFKPINESSGLVKSRTFQDVFWTHNDSEDKARIFAIRRDGSIIKSKNSLNNYGGIKITQAENVDWEEIAVDDAGNLIIADSGNNDNLRKDLTIYFVKEPDPFEKSAAPPLKRSSFIMLIRIVFLRLKKILIAKQFFGPGASFIY